jgi:hypothetical protein
MGRLTKRQMITIGVGVIIVYACFFAVYEISIRIPEWLR